MPTCCRLPILRLPAGKALAMLRVVGVVTMVALTAGVVAAPAAAQVAGAAGFEAWRPGRPGMQAGHVLAPARGAPAPGFEVGTVQPRSVGTVGLGGLAGAAIGVLVLGTAGYYIDRATECNDDFCGLDGILIGGSIGSTAFTPLGAHLANERQGRLVPSLLASAAGTGALWLLAETTGDEEIVLAVPLVNLVTSIIIERATTPAP